MVTNMVYSGPKEGYAESRSYSPSKSINQMAFLIIEEEDENEATASGHKKVLPGAVLMFFQDRIANAYCPRQSNGGFTHPGSRPFLMLLRLRI